MKINNLSSRGLEYLKQVKRHYGAGKWSQQELLLWHPMPHATSQVTQSSLCEHSQQTCPDAKETGLIYNFCSPCKALGECVRWLIWKSRGNLGSMSSQILEACRGKKTQGSPFKVEKKQFGCRLHLWRTTKSIESFSWVQHCLACGPSRWAAATPPQPTQDHPSRQGWRGEATLMETRGLHVSADHCNQQFFTCLGKNAVEG